MRIIKVSSVAKFLLGFITSSLILTGSLPPIVVEAACPPLLASHHGWPADTHDVTYFTENFNATEISYINAALVSSFTNTGSWSHHNTVQGNCSNVNFSTSGPNLATLTIRGSNGQYSGGASAAARVTYDSVSGGLLTTATIVFWWGASYVNSSGVTIQAWNRNGSAAYYSFIKKEVLHEVGHTMGLGDVTVGQQVAGASVMNNWGTTNDTANFKPSSVASCDDGSINTNPQYTCTMSRGYGDPECYYVNASNGMASNYYLYPVDGCEGGFVDSGGCCVSAGSPILIDTIGDGFRLSGLSDPVTFDIRGDGLLWRLGWTAPNTDDAFLALDRNGNGRVDNGTELFGNYTAQPEPLPGNRNGFTALAEYDKAASGGNGDGKIDSLDAVFASLRLWQDLNHNATSEASELHTLPSLNVSAISTDYKESKRADEYGNRFRYRAKVYDARGARVGRWAWDVFFVKQQ